MPLVPERSGRGQEEGAGDHGAHEGKAEEEEWMAVKSSPVRGCPCFLVGGRAELLRLECWHYCGGRMGGNAIPAEVGRCI